MKDDNKLFRLSVEQEMVALVISCLDKKEERKLIKLIKEANDTGFSLECMNSNIDFTIQFCETQEKYETCGALLKLKKKINNLK
jgi:hypothetical protein